MKNVRARRGFTLLEMLIVMAIAMIMMGALVSGYQKIKHGQDLSLGASAVQGTLQSARAQAMQLGKAVYVYFLDGGKMIVNGTNIGYNFNKNQLGSDSNGFDADGYLRAYTTYDVPYELLTATADGEELGRAQLPSGVAWVSLGSGAGKYTSDGATYHYAVDKKYNTQGYNGNGLNRNCSLIICFSPSGSSWSINAVARDITAVDYSNTLNNIRIFLLDDLISIPAKVTKADNTAFAIITDIWASTDLAGTGASGDYIRNLAASTANLKKIKWLTVKMNYTTGLCQVVDGATGE